MPSFVWDHFDRVDAGSANCHHCNAKIATGGGTSNLRNHLQRKHKEEMGESESSPKPIQLSINADGEIVQTSQDESTAQNESSLPNESEDPDYHPEEPEVKPVVKRRKPSKKANKTFESLVEEIPLQTLQYVEAVPTQTKVAEHDDDDIFGMMLARELRKVRDDKKKRAMKRAILITLWDAMDELL